MCMYSWFPRYSTFPLARYLGLGPWHFWGNRSVVLHLVDRGVEDQGLEVMKMHVIFFFCISPDGLRL